MKAIFSGLNGTVAPVVASYFKEQGHKIKGYDRDVLGTEDYGLIKTFLETEQPDIFLHFALGDEAWSEMLAKLCKKLNIKFIYISSVSVYGDHQKGPFTTNDIPEPSSEYGQYKLNSEIQIKKVNGDSTIVRIGWQIGNRPGSNTMLDFIDKQMRDFGIVYASEDFYPSCSTLEVTAEGIYQIAKMSPELYHLNSNLDKSFYDIVTLLKKQHPFIKVKKTNDPIIDHRMIDERFVVERL